ncbi:hypothetical protein [Pseudoalteromonas sp. T1lg23B]|uniref:hypothetical protein n=1 Tax=Pseudoalteromonas sp. T1lg23B TaxID=2077097 RepID=UPI000CF662A1|nr:hypothetical protein [Pseudoalteromonas sp. T1lg23B]
MTIKRLLSTCTFVCAVSTVYANDYVGTLNIDTNNLVWSPTASYSTGQVVREGSSGDLFIATTNINVTGENSSPITDSQRWTLLVKGEVNPDDLIQRIPQGGKAIFVTSQDISGYEVFDMRREEVDAICQTAADASENAPEGTYGAIIALRDGYLAIRSISYSHAYYLLDGTKVANDKEDFIRNHTLAAIDIDENLNQVTSNPYVWTNSSPGGNQGHTESCLRTYNDPGKAYVGKATQSRYGWMNIDSRYCNQSARLYCAQK